MKKLWSKAWIKSSQTRKQRKYVFNAPLHIRHKLVSSSLSKELRKEYNTRSLPVRKGDEVQVMTGQFKGVKGKITKVSLSRLFAHVEGAELTKADGTKSLYPINPSNLMIVKLNLEDKLRKNKIERFKKNK